MPKKKQRENTRTKQKKKSPSTENPNGKRVRQGSLPHVPNALTLEAYISLVAHMLSVGVFAIICCCLSISAEVRDRTIAISNRMTCYYRCAIGLLVRVNALNVNIFFQHSKFDFYAKNRTSHHNKKPKESPTSQKALYIV